jgi:hypothetical protein
LKIPANARVGNCAFAGVTRLKRVLLIGSELRPNLVTALEKCLVPEATVANAAGIRVAGLCCITNMAAGISGPHLSHDEVLAQTLRTLPVMAALADAFLKGISALVH